MITIRSTDVELIKNDGYQRRLILPKITICHAALCHLREDINLLATRSRGADFDGDNIFRCPFVDSKPYGGE